jgi:hypothetical protein
VFQVSAEKSFSSQFLVSPLSLALRHISILF